jgi:enoyl-CoA hydratase
VTTEATELVLVQHDTDRGVATVTLNRPEARNALNTAMLSRLDAVLADVLDKDDVGAVVLTGADPAFCAGLDLRELGDTGENLNANFVRRLRDTQTPVIGAVNGAAVTGGLELALACDFLVASERARFADTHARVGVMPGAGMSVLLPQAIGLRRAKELSLSGRFLAAEEAYEYGLVNRVVAHAELLHTAVAIAHEIAQNVRPVVRRIKGLMDANSLVPVREGLRNEHDTFVAFVAGHDPADVAARREAVIEKGRRLSAPEPQ